MIVSWLLGVEGHVSLFFVIQGLICGLLRAKQTLHFKVPLCCEKCESRVKEQLLDVDGKLRILLSMPKFLIQACLYCYDISNYEKHLK